MTTENLESGRERVVARLMPEDFARVLNVTADLIEAARLFVDLDDNIDLPCLGALGAGQCDEIEICPVCLHTNRHAERAQVARAALRDLRGES